jgi:hypothetical protein
MRTFATAAAVVGGGYYIIESTNILSITNTPANNTNATTNNTNAPGGTCDWLASCKGCPDTGEECDSKYAVTRRRDMIATSDWNYIALCCPNGATHCVRDVVYLMDGKNPDYMFSSDAASTCPRPFSNIAAAKALKLDPPGPGFIVGCRSNPLQPYKQVMYDTHTTENSHAICTRDQNIAIGVGLSVLLGAGLFFCNKRKNSDGGAGSTESLLHSGRNDAGTGDDLDKGEGEGETNCCMKAVCCAIQVVAN